MKVERQKAMRINFELLYGPTRPEEYLAFQNEEQRRITLEAWRKGRKKMLGDATGRYSPSKEAPHDDQDPPDHPSRPDKV